MTTEGLNKCLTTTANEQKTPRKRKEKSNKKKNALPKLPEKEAGRRKVGRPAAAGGATGAARWP